ncbi:MAG: glycosyl hydrolase family 8 [Endomicrobia bacterium]|nr:glycosyl hydrolase family 8 [Endomicrobiia bacterium]
MNLIVKQLLLFILYSFTTHLFSANYPFPQSVNYLYGIKPNNVNQNQMNQTVLNKYNSWRTNYLTQDGCPQSNMWRVKRPEDGNDTVSEGIAYGMLITVLMTDSNDSTKQYFDGLFRYYKHYNDGRNLMHWRIDANGNIVGYNAATDADEDVALALLFAHRQWGSSGAINYLQEAQTIISALMQHCVESGTYVLKPGDVWGGSNQTNPSYFAPGWYKVFTSAVNNNNWNNVVNKCYDITNYFYNNYQTGLVPDWCQASGVQAGGASYDYKYDACRFPWRYGVDYLWYGNQTSYNHLKKLSNWIQSATSGQVANIKDGYQLNGNQIGSWTNAAFVGPFAVGAMCDSNFQNWLNSLYSWLANRGVDNYYNDSLLVLTLLVVTGNFPNLWSMQDAINVYLVNPSSGSIVEGSTSVVVNTYTSGNVDRVEFYVNNVLKHTDKTFPYSWSWDTTQQSDGGCELKVVGYTTAGSSDTKKVWVIINNVKELPTIHSISLNNGTTVQGVSEITVIAQDDTLITKVEFYINSVLTYTKTSEPFIYSWNTTGYKDGQYQLKIKVYDSDNLFTEHTLTIFVDNIDSPPNVSFVNLQNGTTVQGLINIQALASDDKGVVNKIELYIDNILLTTLYNSENLSYNLDTTIYSDSVHFIKVVAYDTQNQTANSTINLYFDNIDNPPEITVLFYDNQIVSGTLSIPIKFSDDKGISYIEYYVDDICVSTATTYPFGYILNTLNFIDGQHTISLIAFDIIGQSSFSYTTVIFDNTPPDITVLSPQTSSVLTKISTISLTASDNIQLNRLELYINQQPPQTKTLNSQTTIYTYLWDTLTSPTTSVISVVVFDKVGNSISKTINVFVDNAPPTIQSLNLYENQIISGTIKLDITATDNFKLNKLEIFINNNFLSSTTTYPFSFYFNTTLLQDGRYYLKFVVKDSVDNSTITIRSIVVNNSNELPPEAYIVLNTTNNIISGNQNVFIYAIDDNKLDSIFLYIDDMFFSSTTSKFSSYTYLINFDTTKFSDGMHNIKVIVYDSLTLSTEIIKMIEVDNTPPTITYMNPINGSVLSGQQSFVVQTNDKNSIIFFEVSLLNINNEEILKVSTTTSQINFEINTKKYLNGLYQLKAVSKDKIGNIKETTIVFSISNIDEKPRIVVSLNNNSTVIGQLDINTYFEDDYNILKVEFYINEQLIETYYVDKSSDSYIFSYNTELLSDGEYIIKFVVYDNNLQTTQKLISIYIDNIKDKQFIVFNEDSKYKTVNFGSYVKEIKIYNKMGKLVFYSSNQSVWDGKDNNGVILPTGLYIYCVTKQDNKKNLGTIFIFK